MTDSKRNPYFDTIKFILIFLVVFGHLLESKMGKSLLCNEMHAFIYLFHMPLFIFISGYFSNRCDRKKFWKSELRLFETLIVFHVGSLAYKLAINHSLGLSDLVIPGFGSWYLLSLMCWKAVLQFLPEKWLKPLPFLTASLAISLLGGFVPIGGAFSVQRTFSLFPFFTAGYIVKEAKCLNRLKLNKLIGGGYLLLILLTFIILGNVFTSDGQYLQILDTCSQIEQATYCYSKWGNPMMWLMGRFVFLIVSSGMCISILSVVPDKRIAIITEEGKDSLVYYVYHAFVFRLLLMVYPIIDVEYNFVTLFAGAVIVMMIIYLLKRIPLFVKVLNPISSIVYRK